MSDQVDVDPKLAAAIAAWATDLAAQALYANGDEVPGWVDTVAGLLDDWSWRLAVTDGRIAGRAGTAGTSGVVWRPPPNGVLAGDAVPAALLSAHPLATWVRLRFGVRRCLACGRLGNRGLQPAHPLVSAVRARTWWCIDRDGCRQRRTNPEGHR
jgi:hypothetical protein